ncbi:hypothetical protein T439DRAFT_34909 [Meredithblackwellia eburnea MCA 4105]
MPAPPMYIGGRRESAFQDYGFTLDLRLSKLVPPHRARESSLPCSTSPSFLFLFGNFKCSRLPGRDWSAQQSSHKIHIPDTRKIRKNHQMVYSHKSSTILTDTPLLEPCPITNSPAKSPLLHPALSTSLSRSFGLNSPFSLSALSSSLTQLSSSPNLSGMSMSLGRSFEERPKLEAQFFRNFSCCGLDLQDLHGLLEHFEECHVAFEDDAGTEEGGMEVEMDMDDGGSDGTISGPPSPRLAHQRIPGTAAAGVYELKKSALGQHGDGGSAPDSPATAAMHLDSGMELDMEMGDEPSDQPTHLHHLSHHHLLQSQHLPISSTFSLSGNQNSSQTTTIFQPPGAGPTMSSFESSVPGQPLASTSNTTPPASASSPSASNNGTVTPGATTSQKKKFTSAMVGVPNPAFDALSAVTGGRASMPGTPTHEGIPPPGTTGVEPSIFGAVGGSGIVFGSSGVGGVGGTINPSTGLAPSLLFPGTPSESSGMSGGEDSEEIEEELEEEEEEEEEEGDGEHQPGSHVPGSSVGHLAGAAGASHAAAHPNGLPPHLAALSPAQLNALHPLGTGVQISPSGRPYTPPSEKPFKCSVPGCDKSYKQQNGLKYHRLHGHCNANGKDDGDGKGEGKPYVCHVGSCGKRYKNMNGLRYHYQHSGAHGALGLQMLAQGCHPSPQFPPGHKRANGGGSAATSRTGSPAGSRAASPMGFPRMA